MQIHNSICNTSRKIMKILFIIVILIVYVFHIRNGSKTSKCPRSHCWPSQVCGKLARRWILPISRLVSLRSADGSRDGRRKHQWRVAIAAADLVLWHCKTTMLVTMHETAYYVSSAADTWSAAALPLCDHERTPLPEQYPQPCRQTDPEYSEARLGFALHHCMPPPMLF